MNHKDDGTHLAPRASRKGRDELLNAIHAFIEQHAPCADADLLEQMVYTVCRLAKDRTGRGELKILNRALKELRLAFKTFAPFAHVRKATIFGSARTPETHPQYQEARKFAELIQAAGWMVITGAGDGIMRAGHHGATRESSFGVAISLPFEQSTNDVIAGDEKLVNFRYFFTRKLMFVKEANAIVLFPGGFGTQDEGFEALTLVQTGKSHILPIVLCDEPGGTYWQHWRTYVKAELLGTRMISPEDMDLFHVTDRAEDAVRVVTRFYRRYHSQRFVKDELVLRMLSPIGAADLDRLNATFADILTGGTITQFKGALPDERGELADLYRLKMSFNRRSMGRLRKLIDFVNDAE
ncbi:MAG: LOG family protein [Phycisphaerae bacterium]|nr:LOG family protein [Phycisphaerae bacterium]